MFALGLIPCASHLHLVRRRIGAGNCTHAIPKQQSMACACIYRESASPSFSLSIILIAVETTCSTYIRSTNVLSRSSDPTSLYPALSVDSKVPRMLNVLLDIENTRNLSLKLLMTLGFGPDDIGAQHLNVSIATKST